MFEDYWFERSVLGQCGHDVLTFAFTFVNVGCILMMMMMMMMMIIVIAYKNLHISVSP